jgi:alpha-methylacyl-CoA racemase
MTGWGQDGPFAKLAGHDLNYIAVTGALHAIGEKDGPPHIPLNLLGDYAGGSLYLIIGILAALHRRRDTGTGAVIDAAIVDGVSHLLSAVHGAMSLGIWEDLRGVNFMDGGMPYYALYETADGEYMAVTAVEAPFYAKFISLLGIDEDPDGQSDQSAWPRLRATIAAAFRSRTQAEWDEVFSGTDACVAPVLSLRAAAEHPHIAARGTITRVNGELRAGPAPRFLSRASYS